MMGEVVTEVLEKVPDPLFIASGRLSHAIRTGEPDDVIMTRRRELVGAQLERWIMRVLEPGIGPTEEQAKSLCDILMGATRATAVA